MNSGRAEVRTAHGELVEPLNGLNDLNEFKYYVELLSLEPLNRLRSASND